MKRVLIWCFLTEKRLMKKISYVVVLLMVPVLIWAFRLGAREAAGMLRIALYTPAAEGTLSHELTERFLEEKSILRYVRFDSEEEALKALREDEADAAWIFPEDLEGELRKYAERHRMKPAVRVVEREDNVALTFSREILCSRLYAEFAYEAYVAFVREKMGEETFSEEQLKGFYDEILWRGSLFQPEYLDQSAADEEESFVLSPLRGILAIWLVIAGFAALLYYKMDERHGTYDVIPVRKRLLFSFGLQAVVLGNCGIIYLIACAVLGVITDPLTEVLLLLLFLVCIAVFCNIIGLLANRMETIGTLIPFLVLLMIALCPVFIDLRTMGNVRGLLPPYFYLNSFHSVNCRIAMAGYVAAGAILCVLLNFRIRKQVK